MDNMKKLILILLLLTSICFSYDKYLKDKKVYLCKTIATENAQAFNQFVVDSFTSYLNEDIDFIEYEDVNDSAILAYHHGYTHRVSTREKLPPFGDEFPAHYFVVLEVKIETDLIENTPKTFRIVNYGLGPKNLGSFTIGDGKMHNQYYVKIKVRIYSVETGYMYFGMVHENNSHTDKGDFNKEIEYNIVEVIEDFPDLFNDSKQWKYYKKINEK